MIAFVKDGRLSIALNYGENSDWVKNVLAAGEFTLEQSGKKIEIAGVRVIPSDSPDIVKPARIPAMLADSVLYGRVVGN